MFLLKKRTQEQKIRLEERERELQHATESLYKQNLELAVKNKTLSLLRELYQISIQTLDPCTLAGKIAELIQQTLDFELVAFFSFHESDDELVPLKFITSPRWVEVRSSLQKTPFVNFKFSGASKHIFFAPLLKNKSIIESDKLSEVWNGIIPDNILTELQRRANIRSTVAFPLAIDNKILGVLLFSLNRHYGDLVQYEKDSISSFINPIAVAIEKANIYEQLQIANRDLSKANEQQTMLIHFITHQIKGFFTKSRNIFSMILEGDYGPISDELRPIIEQGLESGTKGVATVTDILSAANIKKGSVAYSFAPCNFRELVEGIFQEIEPSAKAKKLDFEFSAAPGNYEISADRGQLQHAIKNLIDNAIKYTPQGFVKVSVEVKNSKFLLSIKDSGVGITEEDKSKLFTEGGHGKDSQKVNVDSTGYGLFIVKGIIEAHHGRVWAESEGAGKGSQFYVELCELESRISPPGFSSVQASVSA